MSLEDFSPIDSPESGSSALEAAEKYKESAKKAASGIKRTKKDEKKAQKYDLMLAVFIVGMLREKKYDELLDELFVCLDAGYAANFLLWILSLVYLPISHQIRSLAGQQEIEFSYQKNQEVQEFDDHHIPEDIRLRVNQWIEDMESISQLDASAILTQRTLSLVLYDEKIRSFTSQTFSFFFLELWIEVSVAKARSYSDFILWELEKTLKKSMPDLRKKWEDEGLEI